MEIDKKALSIRQPWAWLIVNGHKNIENRNWRTTLREKIYIHASKGMTQKEYDNCASFTSNIDKSIQIPAPKHLLMGGIIGEAEIIDCVTTDPWFPDSPWFTGQYGFVLANCQSLPFQSCRGALKFFSPDI